MSEFVRRGKKVKVRKQHFPNFILNLTKYTFSRAPVCITKTELRMVSIKTYTEAKKLGVLSFKLRKNYKPNASFRDIKI